MLRTAAASLAPVDYILGLEGAMMGELVGATDLTKSTAHVHLKTLTEYGYVMNVNNEYHLGTKSYHPGDHVRMRRDYYRVTQKTVSWLDSESSMDVGFAVGKHGRIVSLYGDLGFANMPRFLIDGSPFHIRTTYSGKTIIAEYPEARVREIIDRWGLLAATDDSTTAEDELFAELVAIREQGHTENSGETVGGFWAIDKAVKPPRDEVYESLNLSGPAYVIDEETRATQVELLERVAERFEQGVAELYQTQANEPNEE